MCEEWPKNPPEPTDLNQTQFTNQLPVRKCIYCDKLIKEDEDYTAHVTNCYASEGVINVDYPNSLFGIVVPEESSYVWTGKTGGFACRTVSIRGVLIPIGYIQTLDLKMEQPDINGTFESFDNPQEAKQLYINGIKSSPNYEYGGVNLGSKLVQETLDGVYSEDKEEREYKRNTLSERVSSVWEDIDEYLPFTYERVAAPLGRPVTQEGLRWMNITGHSKTDPLFKQQWVEPLINQEKPVALYYPNSD